MPYLSRQRSLTSPTNEIGTTPLIEAIDLYQTTLMKIFRFVVIVMVLMLLFPPFRFILHNGSEINLGFSFIFSPPLRGSTPGSINIPQLITQAGFVLVIAAFAIGWNMVHHKRSTLFSS